MKHKIHFSFNAPPTCATVLPSMCCETVDCTCHHCGRVTRMAVPTAYHDFEQEAEVYKAQLQTAVNRFNQIVTDLTVMYPGENPVLKYLENEWEAALGEMRERFEEGEEWKQ